MNEQNCIQQQQINPPSPRDGDLTMLMEATGHSSIQYITPRKDYIQDPFSNTKTASTVDSFDSSTRQESISPVHFSLTERSTAPTGQHDIPPALLSRANLMTLVVDRKDSPQISQHSSLSQNLTHVSQDSDSPSSPVTKSLQLMVNSTNRILDEAHQDIYQELSRVSHSYMPIDASFGSSDAREELCLELNKVKLSEDTFKHEMNFAIDKIAYGHPSTEEFVKQRKLIPQQLEMNHEENNNSKHNFEEEENLMDKFLSFLCCNCGHDADAAHHTDME